jgi:chemotaxis protein MotC
MIYDPKKIIVFILITFSVPAWSETFNDRALVELSRELQFHQAQSVVRGGDRTAINSNLSRMSLIVSKSTFPDDLGASAVNALVLYLLGGGSPSLVAKKISLKGISVKNSLLLGVMSFTSGDRLSARKHLGTIDPLMLPPSVGGHIALVQAILAEDSDPSLRLSKLSLARLLLPGSIAEEAALRESAEVAFTAGHFDDLLVILDQYLRRFSKSLYAPTFTERIKLFATNLAKSGGIEIQNKLINVLSESGDSSLTSHFLLMCKDFILQRRLDLSGQIAQSILEKSVSEHLRIRAILYLVASSPLSADVGDYILDLGRAPTETFSLSDRSLLMTVLNVRSSSLKPTTNDIIVSSRPVTSQNLDDQFISDVTKRLSAFQ